MQITFWVFFGFLFFCNLRMSLDRLYYTVCDGESHGFHGGLSPNYLNNNGPYVNWIWRNHGGVVHHSIRHLQGVHKPFQVRVQPWDIIYVHKYRISSLVSVTTFHVLIILLLVLFKVFHEFDFVDVC